MPIDEAAKQLIIVAVKDTEISEYLVVAIENYIGNDENVRLIDCRYEDYSKGKLGFSSCYKKLEITLQKSDADVPQTTSFFVKSRLRIFKESTDDTSIEKFLSKESNIYSTIVPLLDENCQTEKWHATCYLANKNVIVMEDLKPQGYTLFGQTTDDIVGLKIVLATLARFHGSSIITENRLNSNSKQKMTMKEFYPGSFDEVLFVQNTIVSGWCTVAIDLVCYLAKHLNYDSEKIRRSYERMRNLMKPSKYHRNVVCHGDLWGNNVMFRDDGYSANRECILLDFQLVRYAPLAIDLLQLLHINTTRIFREKHTMELVEFYRCSLEKMIRDNGSSAVVPESKDIFAAIEDLRLVGVFTAVMYFPLILMDTEAFTEWVKDDVSYLKFLFESRTKEVLAHMEVNEIYKSRIYDAVVELVEYIDAMSEEK